MFKSKRVLRGPEVKIRQIRSNAEKLLGGGIKWFSLVLVSCIAIEMIASIKTGSQLHAVY